MQQRVHYLDTIKAFGMFLIFYGHFVEKLCLAGSSPAFLHWKLVYSVNIPLFFFLAGIFWNPNARTVSETFRIKTKSRIIPMLFFGITTIPFWLHGGLPFYTVIEWALRYFSGLPFLNWITWFLVCLFTLEVAIKLFSVYFSVDGKFRLISYAMVFYVLGCIFTYYGTPIEKFTGIKMNFWFINEAFIAATFYLFGYILKDILTRKPVCLKRELLISFACGIIFFISFNLNQGPFLVKDQVVMMSASSHGNPILFLITACSGILFIVLFLRILNVNAAIFRFVGANTLIYLGLNGFCLNFFDRLIIDHVGFIPEYSYEVLIYVSVYVSLIMLLGNH